MKRETASRSGTHRQLAGSRPPTLRSATYDVHRAGDASLELTLRLRARGAGLKRHLAAMHAKGREPLSRDDLANRFGSDDDAQRAVERWAKRHRLEIVDGDASRREIEIAGPAAKLARLFRVELLRVRHRDRSWLSHSGAVHVPAELAGAVRAVVGFHQQPLAGRLAQPMDRSAEAGGGPTFTATEIASLYGFPEGYDGRGVTVGVVALGGGYIPSELDVYFRALKLPRPRFSDVSVQGARNAPHGPTKQYDGEVMGDIELVGALAPRARFVVYFAPNSERGFLGAVARAVHDRKHRPTVLSVSWGRNEKHWTRSTLRHFDEVLAEAAALGITVCCSSGDDGAYAERGDRRPGVCFPASSAHVVACGGTSLVGTRPGKIRERAWSDAAGASGGGVSALIARPAWQTAPVTPRPSARQKGRCLPDVAANGDPETGYRVYGLGAWHVGAGTSAAAPLWAGLAARLQQMLGRPVGLFTPFLYRNLNQLVRSGALRPIRQLEGSSKRLRRGWNRHAGLGVPEGSELASALRERPPAPPRERHPRGPRR